MSGRCGQELCENWAGDGDVCICACRECTRLRDLDPDCICGFQSLDPDCQVHGWLVPLADGLVAS